MPVLSSAAALYRTTINRLAIEIRTQDDPTYSSDIGWQITEADWADASATALDLLRKAVAGEQEDSPLTHRLVPIADPYSRPGLDETTIQEWRDLDFALLDKPHAPSGDTISREELSLLPLLEFYSGLVDIDNNVARMYDARRFDRIMNICLILGGILLVSTIGTAIISGIKEFDWSKVPLEGSLGILCGLVIGFILDRRRRAKTRRLVEGWGDRFGCDLKQLRHRRLPKFVARIKAEIARLGGQRFVDMDAETLHAEVHKLMTASGYRPVNSGNAQ